VDVRALPSRLSLPHVQPRAWFVRFAPTRRSLAVGFGLLAVALGGYLVARVPNAVFFTLATFLCALVPALGATVAVLAVAALKLATGHAAAAIFLAAYGLVVVGIVDNLAKPLLMRGGLEIHGAVIFFALLGGLAVFGPIGLVAGPLAVAFLIAVVRIYRRDFGDGGSV
jgi:predicted PurR-regulated permease PerM